jgi:hypothetical protein
MAASVTQAQVADVVVGAAHGGGCELRVVCSGRLATLVLFLFFRKCLPCVFYGGARQKRQ